MPLIVEDVVTGKYVPGHPADRLLAKPNRLTTRSRFIETLTATVMLDGTGYAVRDGGQPGGVPESLFVLMPRGVSPVMHNGNPYSLLGWEYVVGANHTKTRIPVEDLARVEYAPDPYNPLRGVTPLGALRLSLDVDYMAKRFNAATLRNGGVPSGILNWKGERALTDDQLAEARRRWQDRHGGPDNAEKTAVLGGNFEWQQTSISPKDLQWAQMMQLSRAEVGRGYKTPPLFLGDFEASGLSDAGLRIQKRMLYEESLIPLGGKVDQALTELIFPNGGFRIVFDWSQVEALHEGLASRARNADFFVRAGWPLNVVNKAMDLGMPDLPWGNESFLAAGMTTAKAIIEQASLPPEPPVPAPPAPPAETPPTPTGNPPSSSPAPESGPAPTPEAQAALDEGQALHADSSDVASEDREQARAARWRAYVDKADPFERGMKGSLRRFIMSARAAMIHELATIDGSRSLERSKADDADRVSRLFEPGRFAGATRKWITKAFDRGAESAAEDISAASAEATNFQAGRLPEIQDGWLDSRIGQVTEVGDAIREKVRDSLLEGYWNGEALHDLQDRVRGEMDASFFRASMIARTETHIAMNGARFATYGESKVVEKIEWLTARDNAVRPTHRAQDGDVVDLGEKFKNGLEHPGDPAGDASEVVACRCTALPIVGDGAGDSGDTGN